MVLQVRELELLAEHIVQSPGGFRSIAPEAGRGDPGRAGKAGAQASLAIAADDRVDGQGQGIEFRGLAALDHRAVECLVLVDIELEHFRRADARADLLDADRGERGDAKIGSEFFRCPGDGALALPVKQPLQGGRGQEQRHRQLLAHHRRAHVDRFDAGEHIGHQIATFVCRRVPTPGDLVVGCAVDIVEDRKGQSFFGQRAKVIHIVAIGNIHKGLSIRRTCASVRRGSSGEPKRL